MRLLTTTNVSLRPRDVRPRRRLSDTLLRGLLLTSVVLGLGACRHKSPGTCARDIDCPAASDCRESRCVPRVRWRPASEVVRAPPPAPAPSGEAAPVAVGPTHLTVSVPFVRDAGAAPAMPAPAPVLGDEPPRGRIPLWQERRRSF